MATYRVEHIEYGEVAAATEPLDLPGINDAYRLAGVAASERAAEVARTDPQGLVVVRAVDVLNGQKALAWVRWGQSPRSDSPGDEAIIDHGTYGAFPNDRTLKSAPAS